MHSLSQQEALGAVLDRVGFVSEVIVNKRTGYVVDGHLRVAMAISRGEPSIPVTYVDLSPKEEALILTTLDPIAAMAGADKAQLESLLAGLAGEQDGVRALLDDMARDHGIVLGEPPEDPGAQMDRAEELQRKWGTERGQVWVAGEHRVMCGDSTCEADVAALCAGERADLIVADAPYGVAIADKNVALNSIGRANRVLAPLEGDHDTVEVTAERLWGPALQQCYAVARKGTPLYWFAPQGGDQMMMMMMIKAHFHPSMHQLIWKKNVPTFAMGRLDYSYQHEPIIYTWRESNREFYGTSQTSIIEIDRPSRSPDHATTKPVELIEVFLRNSSKAGERVYDPFLGSGTTLVACEQLGRRGFGMEIEPKYVAVTLERLSGMGLTPTLTMS